LIADLESRRGVLEYVELSGESEEVEQRPKPNLGLEDEFGFSELIQDQNNDASEERKLVKFASLGDVLEMHSRLVLVGDAGSSKTTTVRRLALKAARDRLSEPVAPLPLLINLSEWKSEDSFENFIFKQWLNRQLPSHINPNKLLVSGDVLLYLDGLNEMGGKQTLKACSAPKSWTQKCLCLF